MKKKIPAFIAVSLILLLTPAALIQGNTTSTSVQQDIPLKQNELGEQDGRFIEKLQWYSPNGELPGTYEDYLLNHPYKPARFSTPKEWKASVFSENYSLAILVNENLYPLIDTRLLQYISDLTLEGYVVAQTETSGGNPEDIKSWIQEQYSTGTTGVLFVGDIPAAWAEVSGDQFPSDLFYMDLDGTWRDANDDGVYEVHEAGSGDMGPEVYVGRIYVNTLTYDSEANMVNDYFAKAHAYRTGELTQPWRGLEYVEEDWFDMDVNLNLIYEKNVTRHDYGFFTTAEDYLNQMDLGQHFVQVCVHSYSGGHYFSTRPTESAAYAHIYIYSPSARQAKLLLGCDDGVKAWVNGINVLTKDRYGGWSPDQYTTNISLNLGWNRLLCKVSQDGGDYQLSARVSDLNGSAFNDLSYQLSDPEEHGGEAEYIRSFLLNGFHQDVADNFWEYLTTNYLDVSEESLNPNEGDENAGKIWTRYDAGNPYIDLSDYCNDADYGACYAFVRVYASEQTTCQLWMGYDDGARVWLNGNEVLYDNRYGGFEIDMKKINVTLQPGENRLLIKISEWMGDHGFAARLCTPDGGVVNGLTYDPQPTPITYVGTWLVNGPYANPDKATRLSTDYLGDESNVTPSEGENAPLGVWERGIRNGYPFNIGAFYDRGAWVLSQDIQDRDPPVLFYNLFACGPGRFTDENYLAGAYIFHTSSGLITVASSKSGSMLNFADFTQPLSEGKSIGEAFRLWFDAQAPYVQWEKEWYYGMVVFGDPTLRIPTYIQMQVTKPQKALYIGDKLIMPFFTPVSIGKITIETNVTSNNYNIDRVEFFLDSTLQSTDTTAPYSWTWNRFAVLQHTIKIVAYDTEGHNSSRELTLWKFF
ncbi:MAG: Ig-like domain-containing protein [Euryarchaeota archaeon]|nr:Ig-like domain-containing protein [Euryarchaeota archaeon]